MADLDGEDLTQQATQHAFDPRRQGVGNSGLEEQDVSDIICILHPTSRTALNIVNCTYERNPQHILQNYGLSSSYASAGVSPSEAQTLLLTSMDSGAAKDLALRFSSRVHDPAAGFCFGRNQLRCDVNLDPTNTQKRVSNTHFRIFVNCSGIIMLEDTSTNGTAVDNVLLRRRNQQGPGKRMLSNSSVIEILSPSEDDVIKFVVRIPNRTGHWDSYRAKFQAYREHVTIAEQRRQQANQNAMIPEGAARALLAAPMAGPPNPKTIPVPEPLAASHYGMRWDGGGIYQCTGILGRGAFAIVYHVARTDTGDVFAAKELEKKRFMKNGQIDARLDNEMKIMKSLRHPNIVQYIDYHETPDHLYIIMEYVPFGDLQGYMHSHGSLQEHLAQSMTRQIFTALAYLHKKNVTHRDIKPDNILICSEDPFSVKLTDFGLSKVVKNNETFLKTFCGTLLYCAPEVFPHYDNYVAGKGQKRRRKESGVKGRSYSQLVDIWSYAAVLWFVLCGKPPFEGVMDANGRAMFTKIMETPLDTAPLVEKGISAEAIDLLVSMLNTDPMLRPSEAELRTHAWVGGIDDDYVSISGSPPLHSIPEIDAEDIGIDASQLSLHDRNNASPSDRLHETKRLRGMDSLPLQRYNAHSELRPVERTSRALDAFKDHAESAVQDQNPRSEKLFGEISNVVLKSSGTLGGHRMEGLVQAAQAAGPDDSFEGSWLSGKTHAGAEVDVRHQAQQDDLSHESMESIYRLRDRNRRSTHSFADMRDKFDYRRSSPEGDTSDHIASGQIEPEHGATQDFHQTPKLPQLSPSQETTPRPAPFSRQVDIPVAITNRITAVPLQDIDDDIIYEGASSDNLKHYDRDRLSEAGSARMFPGARSDIPTESGRNFESGTHFVGHTSTDFTKPQRRLGRLSSTYDSFISISINLTSRITTWGRTPSNTHVYPDSNDTRIPKVAFEIWFHAPSLSSINLRSSARQTPSETSSNSFSGDDGAQHSSFSNTRSNTPSAKSVADANTTLSGAELSQCLDLQAYIRTQSKAGIWVNAVHLPYKDDSGRRCYGRLQHGDEILVSSGKDKTALRFIAEFFCGQAKYRRGHGEKPFVVSYTDT